MNTLSELIKKIRHDNIMTQDDLANKLGVSRVSISNLERGKIKAGHRILKAIMRESGIDDLLEMVRLNDNNIKKEED